MSEYEDDTYDSQFMVAIGNPFDGIIFYGPFQFMDEANDWVTDMDPSEDWWLVEIRHPKDVEVEEDEGEPIDYR